MSGKRQATSDLNHDNWDEVDEPEERGEFRKATNDELKSRVIKKARRKVTQEDAGGNDAPRKNIFSGFSGFSKSTTDTKSGGNAASPFSFLAKLPAQEAAPKLQFNFGSTAATKDAEKPSTSTAAATSSFSSLPQTTSNSTTTTTAAPIKNTTLPTFSFNTKNTTDKTSSAAPVTSSSIFSLTSQTNAPKFNSPSGGSLFTTSNTAKISAGTGTSAPSNPETKKSIFGGDSKQNTDKQAVPAARKSLDKVPAASKPLEKVPAANKSLDKKSMEFRADLKRLNEQFLEWIDKNIKENPICVLTPIFKDYNKHLNDIGEEIINSNSDEPVEKKKKVAEVVICLSDDDEDDKHDDKSTDAKGTDAKGTDAKGTNAKGTDAKGTDANDAPSSKSGEKLEEQQSDSSIAKKSVPSSIEKPSLASLMNPAPPASPMFSFGLKKTNDTETKQQETLSSTTTTTPSKISSPLTGIFAGGAKKPTESPDSNGFKSEIKPIAAPMFGFGTNTGGIAAPVPSFGLGTGAVPFSFGNIQPPAAATASTSTANPEDEEDKPPKVEFKKVVEEDAIFSKKCKVYVKKDDNFVDRGIGTLYLKPVKESEKTQLIVRADTNLGNILINLILSKGLPSQLKGKNNVMLVGLPTPDVEKPTPILFRVKTSEDANELLELIKKHTK